MHAQDSRGLVGARGNADSLLQHSLATVALWEATLMREGYDAGTPALDGAQFLLLQELPRGGWLRDVTRLDQLRVGDVPDPITSVWASFAFMSTLKSEYPAPDQKALAGAALGRSAGSFRRQADRTTGLILRDGHFDPMATLAGLVIRRIHGEDIWRLPYIDGTINTLIDARPTHKQDPTFTYFMTWLLFDKGGPNWKQWERDGVKPLLASMHMDRLVAVKHDATCGGSLGAQALADMTMQVYFRRRMLLGPEDPRY